MPKWMSRALLIGVFSLSLVAGCQPPPLLSYPYFWEYTKTRPNDSDLVGRYQILKARLPNELSRSVRERSSEMNLEANHVVVFNDVPEFDDAGQKLVCRLSGTANWELDNHVGEGWSILFRDYHPKTKPVARECDLHNVMWDGTFILSRHAPYRLYSIIGDPDSGAGIEYARVGP